VSAIVLAKNGINVRIVEKNPEDRPGQGGPPFRFVLRFRSVYALVLIKRGQPRSQELYSFIGVLPEMHKLATPMLLVSICSPGDEQGQNGHDANTASGGKPRTAIREPLTFCNYRK
jgi:2-polyprenyl-6-methoxyphenol hydroxylase-like FAD-dependent oxidoreductase